MTGLSVPEKLEPLLSGVRFGKFVSVGVLGAVSDTIVLAVATLVVGLPQLWAKAVGIETAILVMFLVNEHWTFAGRGSSGHGALLTRLGKSHLVRIGGVSVQLLVFAGLTQAGSVSLTVAGTDVWFLLASLLAIAVAMSVNYAFESLFTWEVQR
jgi:putative flippase GtrA